MSLNFTDLFNRVEPKLKGMTKPLKPVPVFKQVPGETKKAFYRRMDRTVNVSC